ncbi:MAG: CARDB domain-containing protein [Peptococcia bacterium]
MRLCRIHIVSVLILFAYILTSILPANTLPVFAAAPRFAIDEYNSRQIKDSFTETGLPFYEAWTCDLKGKVNSQPIVVDGYIYVQAGKDLVKLSLEDGKIIGRITVNQHELPSGSSPTYAETTHAPRIYQATRDHRLWAIDPSTFTPIWDQPLILSTDENGDSYKKRYRVTASPFVFIHNHRTYIAIGTANGDATGLPGQYADNGFFIIQDLGFRAVSILNQKMDGEVTGSPIFHNGMIIGTENSQNKESLLIRYLLEESKFALINTNVNLGVPGSPAAEGNYIYVADRGSCIYKYINKNEHEINRVWKNPEEPGDFDFNRPLNSYNLMSPVIGSKYIYLPLQHYNNYSNGGPGAVIAVDKETGLTHRVHPFNSILKSNLLYWKPSPEAEQDYVFVFAYDGTAWVLDGETLEPVPWFYDKKENVVKEAAQLFPVDAGSVSPEMVIADSYLLITDGQGIMHAYKAEKPLNFKAVSLEAAEDREYAPGEKVTFRFTVENTSTEDYTNIPIILTTPDGAVIPGGTVDLAAGETQTVSPWTVEVPPSGSLLYQATINPEGHPEEITAEIKPRLDNTAALELNKNTHDLAVISLAVVSPTDAGKVQNIETVIANNTGQAIPEALIEWQEDGKVIREEKVSFALGESKTLSFAWRAPDREDIVNLAVIADPAQLIPDENRANNFMERYITVNKHVERSCKEPLDRASWDVTYHIITGYHTRTVYDTVTVGTDENGAPITQRVSRQVTDYNNPIWEPVTVTYNESLEFDVSVNTKQGIPTDPKNPKKSDRESRGSWEIIPYAEELSKKLRTPVDPNEITRAGYGFEVTVVTNYQNDWETKVPDGLEDTARPIGGTYEGPTRVIAEFYDPNYKFVKSVEMEQVSGRADKTGECTWMLPATRYTFKDGETIYERKHYTSPDDKDGDYTVRIRVEYAGKNGLYICKLKTVKIWGDMYDDIYTAPLPLDLR